METKALIRKHALGQRDRMPEKERRFKSEQIIQRIFQCAEYQAAEKLLVYVSFRSEVQTEALIMQALRDEKRVYCPRVSGSEMEFYEIASMEELSVGYRGIREPQAAEEKRFKEGGAVSLMIMPGSAFDEKRNRLGYGGGYYDRYLEKHPKLLTLAVCFECQMQKDIPSDAYDKKPDAVLTECRGY